MQCYLRIRQKRRKELRLPSNIILILLDSIPLDYLLNYEPILNFLLNQL